MSEVLRVGLAVLAGIMPILENGVYEEAERDLLQLVCAVAAGQDERLVELREGAAALATAVATTPSSAVAVVAVEVGSCDTYLGIPRNWKYVNCLTFYLLILQRNSNDG